MPVRLGVMAVYTQKATNSGEEPWYTDFIWTDGCDRGKSANSPCLP